MDKSDGKELSDKEKKKLAQAAEKQATVEKETVENFDAKKAKGNSG